MRLRLRLPAVLFIAALTAVLLPVLQSHACAHALDRTGCIESLEELTGVSAVAGQGVAQPQSDNFELVGSNPLFNRGMNAALAVHGDYLYVGNRTDGQPQHRNAGILVVDKSDPSSPEVVGEISSPDAGKIGETSRELRVWPQAEMLVVLNFGCSSLIHACAGGEAQGSRITFFDISGDNAAAPKLISTYKPSRTPHEFYLWVDPAQPEDRALLYWTAPTSSTSNPNLVVTDISRAKKGEFTEHAWAATFPARRLPGGDREDRRLHSIGVSNDGTRAYLAFLGAGFLVLDTSDVAQGTQDPAFRLVTPAENRVTWTNPGAHSAVKLWGSDTAMVTDEVYGDALDPITGDDHGCPWGWVRFIDIADEAAPQLGAEYKVEQNDPAYCESAQGGGNPLDTHFTSYSAHNPTFTPNLAFISWHSAGLQAVDISDPTQPTRAGEFVPQPLAAVGTEDPALSAGLNKVVMWSYPVIDDGLIYVVDVRNGLYILRYTGQHAEEVGAVDFLEGNSNLGDALRFESVS